MLRSRLLQFMTAATAFAVALMIVAAPASAKTTIRIAHWLAPGVMDAALAEFMKEYPDIEVKQDIRGFGGFHDKIMVETAGGSAPDVYFCSLQYFGGLAKAGVFYPLDQYVKRDNLDLTKFLPDPRYAYSCDRSLYAIQQWLGGGFTFLFVNEDLTDAAGLYVPKVGNPDFDTWHWRDFQIAARKTTRTSPDGQILQWGMSDPRLIGIWPVVQLIWENGGELFDKPDAINETKLLIDQPAAVQAVQFLAELVLKDKVAAIGNWRDANEVLASGKVAFTWRWFSYRVLAGLPFKATIIHPPWEKRTVNTPSQNAWAISAISNKKDAAWTLIKWLTTSDKACQLLGPQQIPTAYMPAVLNFLDHLENKQEQRAYMILLSRFQPGVTNAVVRSPSPGTKAGTEVLNGISQAINDILAGKKDVLPALQEVSTAVNKVLGLGGSTR